MLMDIRAICIKDVRHNWIYDPENLFLEITDLARENGFSVSRIADLDALDNLIRDPPDDVIVVNCHGETMPMPRS